jgi:hypothetical protein
MATPAELLALIDGNIIDNTTNQITPAIVRSVLKEIVQSMPGGNGGGSVPAITTYEPLSYDGFTGVLKFLPAKMGSVLWVGNGYKWGADPAEENANGFSTEPLPGAFFIASDFEGNIFFSRWNGDGDWRDVANHVFTQKQRIRADVGETPEED